MSKDRIQWENIPEDKMARWLKDYNLNAWPFKGKASNDINREKVQKLYFDIYSFGKTSERKGAGMPGEGKLPRDPNLKILYDILRKTRCSVFDDDKLKKTINNKKTDKFKTCEIAVRDINRFIKTL